jgi:Protein of unknown function (DUF1592)/Protein of unknown function (DUF1588)/PA14 domain/Cytochrome C oxidase, cbb3-type, subunit III
MSRRWRLLYCLGVVWAGGGLTGCRGPALVGGVGSGEKIYAASCAECHGQTGQGVAGKYAEALGGDWALPRLTQYIAKSMPDDHPGTLTAVAAQAVAAYVYEAFYSRAAQLRRHPARIEIAHLTNRQYLVTVADLLRQFGPLETPPEIARGLRVTYYSAAQRGRFDAAKIVHQGVEAELDLTFAEGSAARARVGPAEFSGKWRGAIWADETGDYEFVLRTPNSVRAWINTDPDVALPGAAQFDVNVSNPANPDHRVVMRLIGGRSYPLAIDYWALPEKAGAAITPALALRWKPPHGRECTIPARNLTSAKVSPTFVVSTQFPADDSSQGYERGMAVSKAWDEATTSAAFEVANHVVQEIDRLAGTRPGEATRLQKIEAFAERWVAAAFRRPLSAAEIQRTVTDLMRGAPDVATGVRRVVLLALKSPQFLYTELPVGKPDAPRVAARLALALWDSGPDGELAAAAAAGRLVTRGEVIAQAERLLANPRAQAKLREFFQHWLQLRYIDDLTKDAALYPDFTPEIMDDLRTSLGLFVDSVAWSDASDFRELLLADYLYVNERLAKFYDLPSAPPNEFVRVVAPAGERAGVLTHPYILAALSYRNSSSPIHRGVFLTRSIVGRALKSPPMAQTFDETVFAAGMTMRKKVERLTRSENCQGCHAVINPLGFSLEWYDAVGRFRREENGRPIDAVSDYVVDEIEKVRIGGARDVAEFTLRNQRALAAFIEQLCHHIVKQPVLAYGPDTAEVLRDAFIGSGYNIKKLMVDIATLHACYGAEFSAFPQPPTHPPHDLAASSHLH